MLVAILACSSKMTALFWGMGNNAQLDANTTNRLSPVQSGARTLMLALTIGQPMPLSPMVLFGKPI